MKTFDSFGRLKVAVQKIIVDTLEAIKDLLPKVTGDWAYTSGVSGIVTLTGNKRVMGITAYCDTSGSITINGGDSITIPAGTGLSFEPVANLVDPTIDFVGTTSYVVEWVV
jgi:hypothetical protein